MRIVILTWESLLSNLMTERLLNEYPGQVVAVVRSTCLIHGRSLPAGLFHLARRTGLRFAGRKALEACQSRVMTVARSLIGREPGIRSLREMQARYGISVIGSADVNSPSTMRQIRAWQPDLLISIYLNQRIKAELISLPPGGTLNIHPSLLPRHRGIYPFFWVIAAGETRTGVTVHWVNEEFDSGDVLLQEMMSVEAADTVVSLSYRSAALGAEMLVRAVALVAAGNPPRIIQDHAKASYHSWPSPADQRRFRERGGRYGSVIELWKRV